MLNLLYNIQEVILLVQYGTAKPTDDTWGSWDWYQGGGWFDRHLKIGVFDYWQLHEYSGWLIDTKLSPNEDKNRLLANLCEVLFLSAAGRPHDNPASFEFIVAKLLERGLTLDVNHSPGFVHRACRKLECHVWHQFVCLELHYGITHRELTNETGYPYRDEEIRFNWHALETFLRFGADPDIYLSTEEEKRGVVLGPTGDILYEASDHGESKSGDVFHGTERSKVSLADYIKFRKPPNMDELLRLIQQKLEKEMACPVPIVPLPEDGTNSDIHNANDELSNSIELAGEGSQLRLLPRQTW
jgi:hypothetical protein